MPRAATCDIVQLLRSHNESPLRTQNSESRVGAATEMQSESSMFDRSRTQMSKGKTLTFKRDNAKAFQTLVPMLYNYSDDAESFLVKNPPRKGKSYKNE